MKILIERVTVEQAAWDGMEIEFKHKNNDDWGKMTDPREHLFNWQDFDYRVSDGLTAFWIAPFDNSDTVKAFWTEEDAATEQRLTGINPIKAYMVTR